MLEVTVRCRIDEDTKQKVGVVLDQMGMSLSTAIRLFLKRIAEDGTFPFELNRAPFGDLVGIKAALWEMIRSGQVDGANANLKGIAALMDENSEFMTNNSHSNVGKGLPSIASLKVKKLRKP